MSLRPLILCVDDEPATLESLRRILRKDFEVLTASDGASALAKLKAHPQCSIILSDYRMPGMSGIEFLTKARKLVPNAVRAILSGQIDLNEMMVAVNTLAIHRFILKPWDNEYLRLQMLEALQSHALIEQRNHMEHLSITDSVTQLSNHRFFQDQIRHELERAVRHNRPLSLAIIDVDHFKKFNDENGHPAGDRLLRVLGSQITSQVRGIDYVSRYGGEEFTIIMPDTPLNEALKVAERVRQFIASQPYAEVSGKQSWVTISVGLAAYPEHGADPGTLTRAADQALYQAKRQGRNQTVVVDE